MIETKLRVELEPAERKDDVADDRKQGRDHGHVLAAGLGQAKTHLRQ